MTWCPHDRHYRQELSPVENEALENHIATKPAENESKIHKIRIEMKTIKLKMRYLSSPVQEKQPPAAFSFSLSSVEKEKSKRRKQQNNESTFIQDNYYLFYK